MIFLVKIHVAITGKPLVFLTDYEALTTGTLGYACEPGGSCRLAGQKTALPIWGQLTHRRRLMISIGRARIAADTLVQPKYFIHPVMVSH